MTETAIETRGLTKLYGRTVGIADLDLKVRSGEIFGFLGPNGAGKTTTLRLLLDLIRPTRGRAWVFGLDAQRQALRIREMIGNLPGEVEVWRDSTGDEVLRLFARLRRRHTPLRGEIVQRFELSREVLSRKVREYSRGMKQKLALAVAMAHAPPLLLLDEPTNGLDPLMRESLFAMLLSLRERGHTVLLSSHTLSEVERICERVAIVRAGRLVLEDEIAALRRKRVRMVDAVLRSDVAELPALPGAALVRRQGPHVVLRVQGDLTAALRPLLDLGIEDLTVSAPPLEELFLNFYRDPGAPA